MKTLVVGFFIALLSLPAMAQEQCGEGISPEVETLLSWDIPTKRENGATLALSEIAAYEIYISDGTLNKTIRINEPGSVEHRLTTTEAAQNDLSTMAVADGTELSFSMVTIDTEGAYSEVSQVVTRTLDYASMGSAKPCSPTVREIVFRLKIVAPAE